MHVSVSLCVHVCVHVVCVCVCDSLHVLMSNLHCENSSLVTGSGKTAWTSDTETENITLQPIKLRERGIHK